MPGKNAAIAKTNQPRDTRQEAKPAKKEARNASSGHKSAPGRNQQRQAEVHESPAPKAKLSLNKSGKDNSEQNSDSRTAQQRQPKPPFPEQQQPRPGLESEIKPRPAY